MLSLLVCPGIAQAQFRELVLPEDIPAGATVHAGSTVVGATIERRVLGELVVVGAWTRREISMEPDTIPPFGTRGPRWTRRFGAQLAGRVTGGTGDQPVQLEQRLEVALYAASVGQTVTWQDQPRMTDRQWWRPRGIAVGGFVDFPGFGFVQAKDGDVMSAEALPVFIGVSRTLEARPLSTLHVEGGLARITGTVGEGRIKSERLIVRDTEMTRALALDVEFFSARRVRLARDSAWRMSGAIGLSHLAPTFNRRVAWGAQERPTSFFPLARVGIEHVAATEVGTRRSEIGRPLLDTTDFGVELATLHRDVELVEVGAGVQLSAWWRRRLDARFVLRGEGMVGAGARVLERDPQSTPDAPAWRDARGAFGLARVDVSLTADLAHRITAETRLWIEHSERAGLSGELDHAGPRWSHGAQAGLSWRR